MQETSVHVIPVKTGSEEHNKREKELKYVFHELTQKNQYWESETQVKRLAMLKQLAKERTGRKMQDKATPIREAVVVISESTTMEDLKRLGDAYKKRFGVECFQIAIHRDEGYRHGNDGKLNLHAHMVFDWVNHETGKSYKLNRFDMQEMQTITAEVLGMKRGVSSEKKHLDAIQYKAKAEAEHLKQVQQEIAELSISKASKERLLGLIGKSKADKENAVLRKENASKDEQIKAMQARHQSEIEKAKKESTVEFIRQEKRIMQLQAELDRGKGRMRKLQERLDGFISEVLKKNPKLAAAVNAMVTFAKGKEKTPSDEQKTAVNAFLSVTGCNTGQSAKEVVERRKTGVKQVSSASVNSCSEEELSKMDGGLERIAIDGPSMEQDEFQGLRVLVRKTMEGEWLARVEDGRSVSKEVKVTDEEGSSSHKEGYIGFDAKRRILNKYFGTSEEVKKYMHNERRSRGLRR